MFLFRNIVKYMFLKFSDSSSKEPVIIITLIIRSGYRSSLVSRAIVSIAMLFCDLRICATVGVRNFG
jgi:hypothetical protein